MSVRHVSAAMEEQAELRLLRDQADETAAEAARTLAELGRRLSAATHPAVKAKSMAADARSAVARGLRDGRGRLAGQRGAWRLALAAIPVFAAAAAVVLARRRGMLRRR